MTTGTQRIVATDYQNQFPMNDIIYLHPRRTPVRKKHKARSDAFWNLIFAGLCIGVLVCLFLH